MAILTKKIVNDNMAIIGFELSGKAREFNEIGNGPIIRNRSVNDLMSVGFKNSQVQFVNKQIVELNGFKLKTLSTLMFRNNTFIPVDNNITLVARVLIGGELKGFDVIIAGEKKRLRSSDVIALANIFNGTNFVVRYMGNRKYIAGKSGMALEKLPEVSLTSSDTVKSKRAAVKSVQDGIKENKVIRVSPFDMIDLCSALKELGAQLIYLPGVVYNRTGAIKKETSKEFRKTGVEIAKPEIALSEKKVNISLPFKQIGQVNVKVAGVDKAYYPYTNKNKVIFRGKEINSPYLGVVIEKSKVDTLQKRFGESMSLSLITDMMTNMYVKMFTGASNPDNYALLALDTKNLSPMCIENANKYLMSVEEIKKTVMDLIEAKAALSYTRGVRKEVESYMDSITGVDRPLYGIYRGCSEAELDALVVAGIDVFTGEYTKVEEDSDKVKKDAVAKDNDASDMDVEIQFSIEGLKSAPSYSKIKENPEKALAKLPRALKIVEEVRKIYDTPSAPSKQYTQIKAIEDKVADMRAEAMRKIQLNNIAGFTLGAYQRVKVADGSDWYIAKSLNNTIVWAYKDKELTCTVSRNTALF